MSHVVPNASNAVCGTAYVCLGCFPSGVRARPEGVLFVRAAADGASGLMMTITVYSASGSSRRLLGGGGHRSTSRVYGVMSLKKKHRK